MNSPALSASEQRLRQRALRYLGANQLVPAQAALESLCKRVPADPALHLALGRVCLQLGRQQAASAALLQAARCASGRADLAAELTDRLLEAGESRAAHETCKALLAGAIRAPAERVAVAQALQLLGDSAAALEWMQGALASGADSASDHFFHALLLQFNGHLDEAEARFGACLTRWPQVSGPALERARLRRQTAGSNHVTELRSLQARAPAQSFASAEFGFALFKELDDLGQYRDAWVALAAANDIMHARTPYDAAAEEALTDAIIHHAQANHAQERTVPDQAPSGPMPIFIVGMPRSGSTLLDRMLSNHSRVVSAGELADLHRQLRRATNTHGTDVPSRIRMYQLAADLDPRTLGRRYLEQTQWRAGSHAFYIDKLPANLEMVNLIHLALPRAPILYLARESMATCFSNFKAAFGDGYAGYSYRLQDLGHYYRQRMRLLEHWRRIGPDALMEVDYARLVTTPEAAIRRVLSHCGLAFEQACTDPSSNTAPVDTLSAVQVREGIHSRALSEWESYARELDPLAHALQG